MHVWFWNVLHAARWNCRTQKLAKNRHLGTIAQLRRAISSQLRHVSTIGRNLLSNNISFTCTYNMVNFGPLAAEIVSLVWGTTGNLNGFREHARIRKTVSGGSMIKQAWSANVWHFIVHYETYILVWKQLSSDEFTAAAKCRQIGCCSRKSWMSHRWLSKRVGHMNEHSIAISRATADRPEGQGRGQWRTSLLAVLLCATANDALSRYASRSTNEQTSSRDNLVRRSRGIGGELCERSTSSITTIRFLQGQTRIILIVVTVRLTHERHMWRYDLISVATLPCESQTPKM